MSQTVELLRRWHQGDQQALAELVAADGAWITAHVQRRLGPLLRARVDTQDIVQQTLIEVLRSGPRFQVDDRDHLRALLVRLVENVLRHQARHDRQQKRDVRREQPLQPAAASGTVLQLSATGRPGPATQAAAGEQRDWVRLALELLDPDDRDVIVWREYDGLSFADIAARLQLGEAHARVRFQRALPKLGKKLQQLQQGQLDQALGPWPGAE
jgi:RNA polymerase sigma-70 factor, ECF subfamily